MSSERDFVDEDGEHIDAFINKACFSQRCRHQIDLLRHDDPTLTEFILLFYRESDEEEDDGRTNYADVVHFSDKSWELLGRYIKRSSHLKHLDLSGGRAILRDEKLSLLFGNLDGSTSLEWIDFSENAFGLIGVQSIIPCLRNSPKLTALYFCGSPTINTECFGVILEALDGSSVEKLNLSECSIADITALANYNLPHLKEIYLHCNIIRSVPSLESCTSLKVLDLCGNEIGNEGCRGFAKLLENKSSSLKRLRLEGNGIGDEGAEIIASSLKHNTKLKTLRLDGNHIADRGRGALVKLLCDVSSIENTLRSNHTLQYFFCYPRGTRRGSYIKSALKINQENEGNSRAATRAKVIASQLNSITRMEMCRLQGIEYSYDAIFAGIDHVLLPDLLALASSAHGQNELYRMLVATGHGLTPLMDKGAFMEATIANNMSEIEDLKAKSAELLHQAAALSAENSNIKGRLERLRSSSPPGETKKRRRSTSN